MHVHIMTCQGLKNKMSGQEYLPVNTRFLSVFPSKRLGPAIGQPRTRYFLWPSGVSAPPPSALRLSQGRKKTFAEVSPNKEGEVLSPFPKHLISGGVHSGIITAQECFHSPCVCPPALRWEPTYSPASAYFDRTPPCTRMN